MQNESGLLLSRSGQDINNLWIDCFCCFAVLASSDRIPL